jgi:hypothetical protein
VIEEAAFFGGLLNLLRSLDPAAAPAIFKAGTELFASFGYATAQEGRASPGQTEIMFAVAAQDGPGIDVVVYPGIVVDREFIAENHSSEYVNRSRVGAARLTIDGSPQGFTAVRDRPDYKPPEHLRAGHKGYAAVTEDQVFKPIDRAFENDVHVLTHSNREGASDLWLGALETATETRDVIAVARPASGIATQTSSDVGQEPDRDDCFDRIHFDSIGYTLIGGSAEIVSIEVFSSTMPRCLSMPVSTDLLKRRSSSMSTQQST